MAQSRFNPHQLDLHIADYKELLENENCLKQIAEFVAKYRLFTLQDSSDSAYSQHIYKRFYKIHISPLIEQLEKFWSGKNYTAKVNCLNKIINSMIKNSDHNDSWSVLLIVETYKSPLSWTQIPYRHLYTELTILHSNKEYEGSSLSAQIDRVEPN